MEVDPSQMGANRTAAGVCCSTAGRLVGLDMNWVTSPNRGSGGVGHGLDGDRLERAARQHRGAKAARRLVHHAQACPQVARGHVCDASRGVDILEEGKPRGVGRHAHSVELQLDVANHIEIVREGCADPPRTGRRR